MQMGGSRLSAGRSARQEGKKGGPHAYTPVTGQGFRTTEATMGFGCGAAVCLEVIREQARGAMHSILGRTSGVSPRNLQEPLQKEWVGSL